MPNFDDALDDYLHLIVRTRPWTKKREEQWLRTFGEWLEQRWGTNATLTWESLSLVAPCAAEQGLQAGEREEMEVAVGNLCLWATRAEMMEASAAVRSR